MNIHNINTIARYEVKLLRRSWLFRIFAILVLLILTLTQLGNLSTFLGRYMETWKYLGVSSLAPFFTIYLYSVAQSVIVVFLAGSFLKRDKKLDTAEVIYVRPMSNADYIAGKVWGIVRVFMGLNLIPLAVAMFITLVLSRSPFNLYPYVFYLLTISLPSLLFVLGLSFTVMCLLKNQAVTFIVMLGITGTVFFYLPDKLYGIFDFFGVNIPAIFSDVTGLAHTGLFLWQRAIYLLLGVGLICLTIVLVKRLPHRPWKTRLLALLSVLILAGGCGMGWFYLRHFKQLAQERSRYVALFNQYAVYPKVNVYSHELTVAREGERLEAAGKLVVKNMNDTAIGRLIFYLNPGLQVQEVTEAEGKALVFGREEQIMWVDTILAPGQELVLRIKYEGEVEENICYTDIEDKDYFAQPESSTFKFRYGKRYAYLDDRFTLLTPECLWYPVSEPPVYPARPYHVKRDFTYFTLTVKKQPGETVISQGTPRETDTDVVFENRMPLPGISLTMGDYEKKAITVDSTVYEIYNFRGHDFYSRYFTELSDTLPALIRDLRNEIEVTENKSYPFGKFCMVETPLSFTGYVRNWKGYTEQVMPEIVFVPERGLQTPADFRASHVRMKEWKRRDEVVEEIDIQVRMLRNYIQGTFVLETASDESQWSESPDVNKLNVAAMFYAFTGFFYSPDYPVIDVALNLFQTKPQPSRPFWFIHTSLGDAQRANMYLQDKSFETALSDRSLKPQVLYEMLKLKSSFWKNYMLAQVPSKEFETFLQEFREKHNFEIIDFGLFEKAVFAEFGIELKDFMQKWYTEDSPACVQLRNVDANKVVLDDYTKYQVRFKAYNGSDADAVITVKVESGGRRFGPGNRRGAGEEDNTHCYILPPRSARDIRLINDERPGRVTINTTVSANLPNEYVYHFSKVDNEIADTTQGSLSMDTLLFMPDSRDIIVDNEDPGFRIVEPEHKRKLKDYFRKEEKDKYKIFRPYRFPARWTAVVNNTCYGVPVNSAFYKKRGTGVNRIEWKAELPRESMYEIFVWNPRFEIWWFGGERYRREQNQTYTISYDQETETASADFAQGENGWLSLGTFYLPKGEITVSLSDNVTGQFVVADAVKFSMLKGH